MIRAIKPCKVCMLPLHPGWGQYNWENTTSCVAIYTLMVKWGYWLIYAWDRLPLHILRDQWWVELQKKREEEEEEDRANEVSWVDEESS